MGWGTIRGRNVVGIVILGVGINVGEYGDDNDKDKNKDFGPMDKAPGEEEIVMSDVR